MTVEPEDVALVERTRAAMLVDASAHEREEVARVEDVDAGGVPTRIYRAANPQRTLFFLHGGGFVYGEPDTHDAFARRLANATESVLVFPHYRRAPQDRFPAAWHDTRTAWEWAKSQQFPGQRVLIGDSAGANLALGLAVEDPRSHDALVLVYPFLDPSYDVGKDNPDLGLETMSWFWRMYADEGTWLDPRVDPLLERTYAALPRTLMQLASDDVLVTTGERLAQRMRTDGVDVTLTTYPDVPHGFWRHEEYAESHAAVSQIAAFLPSALAWAVP